MVDMQLPSSRIDANVLTLVGFAICGAALAGCTLGLDTELREPRPDDGRPTDAASDAGDSPDNANSDTDSVPDSGNSELDLVGGDGDDPSQTDVDGSDAPADAESCNGAPRNLCGGCATLAAVAGEECGAECGQGTWVCAGRNSLQCESDQDVNRCGGCDPLPTDPGSPCGPCDLDEFQCDGTDAVGCSGRTIVNECGGCDELPNGVDDPCGPCDLDRYACQAPERVACDGTTFGNACFGCEPLGGEPGDSCGECGVLECDGVEDLQCADQGFNGCGGCAPLGGVPGEACGCEIDGAETVWMCAGFDAVSCRDLNNLPGEAVDVGTVGSGGDGLFWTGVLDTPSDRDFYRVQYEDSDFGAMAVDMRAQRTMSGGPAGGGGHTLCAFYRYSDSRGTDIFPYVCESPDDACVYWDADRGRVETYRPSTGAGPNECSNMPTEFDDATDLAGCCDAERDADALKVVILSGIDDDDDEEVDNSGTAFLLSSDSAPACLELSYSASR